MPFTGDGLRGEDRLPRTLDVNQSLQVDFGQISYNMTWYRRQLLIHYERYKGIWKVRVQARQGGA